MKIPGRASGTQTRPHVLSPIDDERRDKAILVSRKALRLGLGPARELAGLGRFHHMDCGGCFRKPLARAAQRSAVLAV